MIFKTTQRKIFCIILFLVSNSAQTMEYQDTKRTKRQITGTSPKESLKKQKLFELFEDSKEITIASTSAQNLPPHIPLLFNHNESYELPAKKIKKLRAISQKINGISEEHLAQQKFSELSTTEFKQFSPFIKHIHRLQTAQKDRFITKEKIKRKIDKRTLLENLNILKVSDYLIIPTLKDILIRTVALRLQTDTQLEIFVNNYQNWLNQFANAINHDLQKNISENILQPYCSKLLDPLEIKHYEVSYPSDSNVASVVWNTNGTKIAVGYSNGIIHIWDDAFSLINTIVSSTKLSGSVAWSPDNNTLAHLSHDNIISIIDSDNGAVSKTLNAPDNIEKIAWSPDGEKIAIALCDNTIMIFDIASGKPLYTIIGHTNRVGKVSWSPDGEMIASVSDDCTLRIWNSADGALLKTFKGHTDYINSLAWKDNNTLASGSLDKTIIIWNIDEEGPVKTLSGHESLVESVIWNHDGTKIASGSFDNTGYIWDSASGKLLCSLEDPNDVISVTWNHNGTNLASGSGKNFRIWDTTPLVDYTNTIKQLNLSQAILIVSALTKKISRNNDMISIFNTLPESIQKHAIFNKIRNNSDIDEESSSYNNSLEIDNDSVLDENEEDRSSAPGYRYRCRFCEFDTDSRTFWRIHSRLEHSRWE